GFLVTVACGFVFHKLDAGVEASGPHDFTVRKPALSSAAPPASIASQPYVRDDRETPLSCWAGMARMKRGFGSKVNRNIFEKGGGQAGRHSPSGKTPRPIVRPDQAVKPQVRRSASQCPPCPDSP